MKVRYALFRDPSLLQQTQSRNIYLTASDVKKKKQKKTKKKQYKKKTQTKKVHMK